MKTKKKIAILLVTVMMVYLLPIKIFMSTASAANTATMAYVHTPITSISNFALDKLVIKEQTLSSIDNGLFEIAAPNGFYFKYNLSSNTDVQLYSDPPLRFDSGLNPAIKETAGATDSDYKINFKPINSSNDYSVIQIELYRIKKSLSSTGAIYITGLELLAEDNAPSGDINLRISGANGITSQEFRAGTRGGHTVTFNTQGGSPTITSMWANTGMTITLPPDPTKYGYAFEGWFTPTGVLFTNTTPINESMTLSAKWKSTSNGTENNPGNSNNNLSSGNQDSGSSGDSSSNSYTPTPKDKIISITDNKGKIFLNLDTTINDYSKDINIINVNENSDTGIEMNLQLLKELYSKNKNGNFLFQLPYAAYTLPFGITSKIDRLEERLKGENLKEYVLTLSIKKLSNASDEKAKKAYKAKFPTGKLVSEFYDVSFDLMKNDKIVELGKNGHILFNDYINFSLSTTSQGNAVLVYTENGFTPSPSTFTEDKADIRTMSHSIFVAAKNEAAFTDINDHWGKSSILAAADKYLVQGSGNGTFLPDNTVTRAEFTIMLTKALGLAEINPVEKPYIDVNQESWYFSAVSIAKEKGLLAFVTGNSFLPNEPLTREEMASMISKAMAMNKIYDNPEYIDIEGTYDDYNQMNQEFVKDIQLVVTQKIMRGTSETSFEPKGVTTRAQGAAVMIGLLKNLETASLY